MNADEDTGFTLVELLLAVVMSGIIISALFAALIATFRTTQGLAADAPAFGQQNGGVVGNQVAVNNDIQGLTRAFSADVANVTSLSAVTRPGNLPCAPPANNPALSSDVPIVRLDFRDNSDVLHQVNYRFSTDSLRHFGQLTRYDCAGGVDTATILARGLISTASPSVDTLCPSGGGTAIGTCATPVGYRL